MNIIHNENCFDTFKRMEDNSVDIVFTSPPYNRKRNDKYKFYDDQIVDYFGFLEEVVNQSMRVSKGNVFLNIMKNYYNKEDVFSLIGKFSKTICEVFIWEKSNPLPAAGNAITNAYEFILVFGESIKSNKTYTKNHITTSVATMREEHKALMPTKVAEFFIENFTNENDLVYDPFMGCGTTAIAAKRLKRHYMGSEIQPEYCAICEKQIQEKTKQQRIF